MPIRVPQIGIQRYELCDIRIICNPEERRQRAILGDARLLPGCECRSGLFRAAGKGYVFTVQVEEREIERRQAHEFGYAGPNPFTRQRMWPFRVSEAFDISGTAIGGYTARPHAGVNAATEFAEMPGLPFA